MIQMIMTTGWIWLTQTRIHIQATPVMTAKLVWDWEGQENAIDVLSLEPEKNAPISFPIFNYTRKKGDV